MPDRGVSDGVGVGVGAVELLRVPDGDAVGGPVMVRVGDSLGVGVTVGALLGVGSELGADMLA